MSLFIVPKDAFIRFLAEQVSSGAVVESEVRYDLAAARNRVRADRQGDDFQDGAYLILENTGTVINDTEISMRAGEEVSRKRVSFVELTRRPRKAKDEPF